MNWKRGLTRLYVVVAGVWMVISGFYALTIRGAGDMVHIAALCLLVTAPPVIVFALLRALFWAIDGFSRNGGDA